jgi:GNAT superfamily N-acetyltransferase
MSQDSYLLHDLLFKIAKDHDVLTWLSNGNSDKLRSICQWLINNQSTFYELAYNPQFTAISLYSISNNNQSPILPALKVLYDLKKVTSWPRLLKFVQRQQKLNSFIPAGLKIRLYLFGVVPEHRRQGTGTLLIKELIEESIATDLPVFLETSCRSGLSFFASLDFDVYFTWQDPFLEKSVYFMRRMPCGC